MTPERWQQVKELFHAALEREPKFRSDFLVKACGADQSLRAEVESLISSHEEEGSFIDSPAFAAAADLLADEPVELQAGQQFDAYEIIAPIGRGGMGEVYLAADRRLGRKVALKILPTSFTQNADRLRRFEQEARAASALNHPNILTIYEIDEVAGAHFIVTEFIEGETLRQYLRGAQPDADEVLRLVTQIADALAAAHKAGIIHRDIKPENIMLRPDGYVKVLDFGLAKLSEPQLTYQSDEEAPTLAHIQTNPGMVMGTVNYMSPEQARGHEVDARTDIWSLGVVLYECATGHGPFEGETPADTLAHILQQEPPSLAYYLPDVPPELERIVTKALRKDRDERYQTVKDMLLDLKNLRQELEFAAKLERSVAPNLRPGFEGAGQRTDGTDARTDENRRAATVGIKPQTRNWRRLSVGALAALALLLVASISFYKFIYPRWRTTPFQSIKLTRLTNNGKTIHAAISPDGKYVAYVMSDAGQQSLWLRQVSAANDKQIIPPAHVGYWGATFAPDGNNLYYVIKAQGQGGVFRIPILGGTPVKILSDEIDSEISFAPDGKRFAYLRGDYPQKGESGLFIANADGTGVRELAARKPPEYFIPIFYAAPSWSPDGQLIACPLARGIGGMNLIAVRVQDGQEQLLSPHPRAFIGHVQWLPDMSGLIIAESRQTDVLRQLWFLSYPDGAEHPVTNDLNDYRSTSITADGRQLVTVQDTGIVTYWVAPDGDAARAVELPSGNVGFMGHNESVQETPDGQIVYCVKTEAGPAIWIMDGDGNNRRQLTNGRFGLDPALTPDGRYIVFASYSPVGRNLWRMNIDGSNVVRLTNGIADYEPVVSPDGQWIVYSSLTNGSLCLWKVSIDGGQPVQLSNRLAYQPAISPDGKLIAYAYSEFANAQLDPKIAATKIAVMPFTGGDPISTFDIKPSITVQMTLRWSPDGHALDYTAVTNNVGNIWRQPLTGSPPHQITDFKDKLIATFNWSHDNKLICARGLGLRDAVLLSDAH
jgi:eukaryotic-like serine/threonine-protein kinase